VVHVADQPALEEFGERTPELILRLGRARDVVQ
jgi:hypothetical protein